MAQQMVEGLAAEDDLEAVGVGEVGLHRLAGAVLLGEEDLTLGSLGRSPAFDPALEGAQLALVEVVGPATKQILEERLRLQLGRRTEAKIDLGPDIGEGILTGAPPPSLLLLVGKPSALQILTRGLAIHSGLHRRPPHLAILLEFLHQLPHLGVGHSHLRTSLG